MGQQVRNFQAVFLQAAKIQAIVDIAKLLDKEWHVQPFPDGIELCNYDAANDRFDVIFEASWPEVIAGKTDQGTNIILDIKKLLNGGK